MKPPRANEKCLCGSNLKFKKCCFPILPKAIADMHKKYKECWMKEDLQGMLRAARADVTKYTICHRSHTVVALQAGLEYAPRLFEIDIDALADYVEFLMRSYQRLGRLNEFPVVLERLRSNISAPRWNQKIIYFHSFCALGTDWNEDAGRLEIRKLGSIKDISDPEILAHYLNLIRDELSLDENLRLIEKIRSKSRLLNTQIHQGAVKANLLLCHGDFKGASNTLAEVIESVEDEENDLNIYQRDKYAQCLYLLATLGLDSKIEANTIKAEGFLRRSEEQHKILIKDGWGSDKFLAQLHRGLADCLRVRDQWEDAVTEYQKAYDLDGKEIHRVFEAECLYEDECITEALNVIDAVNFNGLDDDGCKIDYIVRYSRMSINEGNLERLDIAKHLLTTPLILAPHFKRQQQNALIQVMEAIEEVRKNPPKSRKKFSLGLSKFSSYFILQPNFLGVGLNVNKIIDDGVKKPNEHNILDDEKKRT